MFGWIAQNIYGLDATAKKPAFYSSTPEDEFIVVLATKRPPPQSQPPPTTTDPLAEHTCSLAEKSPTKPHRPGHKRKNALVPCARCKQEDIKANLPLPEQAPMSEFLDWHLQQEGQRNESSAAEQAMDADISVDEMAAFHKKFRNPRKPRNLEFERQAVELQAQAIERYEKQRMSEGKKRLRGRD